MATSKIKKPTTAYLLQDDIVMEEVVATYNIGANASIQVDMNIAKTGYTPFGIVGFNSGAQAFAVSYVRAGNNGTTLAMGVKNTLSTAYDNRQARVDVLYIKNKS